MGEDIHCKTLIYSKVEKKYIDGLSLSTCPEYSPFKPLYQGRNYDLFSIFGSRRSDYPELQHGEYGLPDFVPQTYKQYLEDTSYYGYVWWRLPKFKKALDEYQEMLSDPEKFYEALDIDYYLEMILNGTFDFMDYDKEVTYLSRTLKKFLQTVKEIELLPYDFERYDKLIDVQKTVFLFYFDS